MQSNELMSSLDSSLHVSLGDRSYQIVFSTSFDDLATALVPLVLNRSCAVVTNPTVWSLYGEEVVAAIRTARAKATHVFIPDGEQFKNMAELDRMLDQLAQQRLDRSAILVALGGGVVGDMAGFAAACYMRGIDYIQIPTTLLAQVDSSVGGKTGVNLESGKNLVGAFHQPRLVYVNWRTLATLPLREVRAGYAEVIKYGIIAAADLFARLENTTFAIVSGLAAKPPRVADALGDIIRRCCEIKADIVSRDERESNIRALLNYGHTFAHAIEMLTDYRTYVHGEAVAIGMHAAATLAYRLGLCSPELVIRQKLLIASAGLPVEFPDLPADTVIAAFQHDKKTAGSRLRFILPREIGLVDIVTEPDPAVVRQTIEECTGHDRH